MKREPKEYVVIWVGVLFKSQEAWAQLRSALGDRYTGMARFIGPKDNPIGFGCTLPGGMPDMHLEGDIDVKRMAEGVGEARAFVYGVLAAVGCTFLVAEYARACVDDYAPFY
jgi:hypothetical protein